MTTGGAPRANLTRPQAQVALALLASAAAGVALGLGNPLLVVGAFLAVAAVWAVRVLLRLGRETTLLALAGTSLAPAPQALRIGLLAATVAIIACVAMADRLWPTDATRPLEPAARVVLGGLLALDACLAVGTITSGEFAQLAAFAGAVAISATFMWALYDRARAAGREPIAMGIAAASVIASLIVLLRLGGLPLIGSSAGGDYADAKDAIVGELGDVNGQALIVMLGLPFLLAFTLHARERVVVLACAVATALAGLSLLVLLSRSSLVGGVVGVGLVTVLMARLSRRRVALLVLVAAAAAVYLGSGIERISADDRNLGTRSVLWGTAVDFWHQSPILGHGANSWSRLVEEQVRWSPSGGRGGTHNLFLSGLVSGGLIAAVLMSGLIVAVAYLGARNLRRLRASGDTAAYAAVAGAMGAFAAQISRGVFEATGWPGTRVNDLQTWAGLLMVGVVVLLTTSAPRSSADERANRPEEP